MEVTIPKLKEKPKEKLNVEPEVEWQPAPPPTDLIFDDGEPLETNRHRTAMNLLIGSLNYHWRDRDDYFVGGNMFIYFSNKQVFNKDFRGPDFFAVLDIDGTYEREGWVVWLEEGRYPDIIIELMSQSTKEIDKTVKKSLYERTFHTPDYFVYSPFDSQSLQGWHLDANQHYQPLQPNEQGWLWSETLKLWLGTWQGTIQRQNTIWLRFYDSEGNLVLLDDEAAKIAIEQVQERADQEKKRADQEKDRADQEKDRADQEKDRADRLAAKLKELGFEP